MAEYGTQKHKDDACDVWSAWLHHRSGGDADYARVLSAYLAKMRDRVLDNAILGPGQTLLDIGSGDGLIPFGAIERIGSGLDVIFSDISRPMLTYVRNVANAKGVLPQCRFAECSADRMGCIASESADVVTSRAALAFVADKVSAFAEMFRVTKPGGRISLCEPILQDDAFDTIAMGQLLHAQPDHPQARIMQLDFRLNASRYPSTVEAAAASPITNYSERDLLNMAVAVGFRAARLELHIDVRPGLITSWDVFLSTSPHPWAPTAGEVLEKQFTADERAYFESVKRPVIEQGRGQAKDAFAYLTATKPRS